MTPEEYITRGQGNYHHCTDYETAIEAMKKFAADYHSSILEKAGKELPSDDDIEQERIKRFTELKAISPTLYFTDGWRSAVEYLLPRCLAASKEKEEKLHNVIHELSEKNIGLSYSIDQLRELFASVSHDKSTLQCKLMELKSSKLFSEFTAWREKRE